MKKTSNLISILIFVILLPFTFIANLIADFLDAWKVKTDLPEDKTYKSNGVHTTLPDEPTKDFNSWSQYINRQLN